MPSFRRDIVRIVGWRPGWHRAQRSMTQAKILPPRLTPNPGVLLPDCPLPKPFAMPLLLTGRGFRRDLESAGALALYAPLEGGAETRLLRRMRAASYHTQLSTCRGLGDPESFLLGLHGVRPPHLGHQCVGREAAVGEVQLVMPQLGPALASDRPVLLWLLEGQVLSAAERRSLVALCRRESNLFMVVEMGGARALRWSPLDAVTDD